MGLLSRVKGRTYERKIAALFRSHWPDATVRRSSQAERAYQSDVFVEGGPSVLRRLWLELTDARKPNVLLKLGQAETDATAWNTRNVDEPVRWPVVIWHVTGERNAQVTMPMWVLDAIRGMEWQTRFAVEPATMDLRDFVRMLRDVTSKEAA
jgi:hypothetical protein